LIHPPNFSQFEVGIPVRYTVELSWESEDIQKHKPIDHDGSCSRNGDMPIMGGSFVSLQEMTGISGGDQHRQTVEAKSYGMIDIEHAKT
jgi:hypothetical protein